MKKRLQHNHFRMNIVKSLRTPISKNIIWECLILQQDNRLFQEKSKQGGVGGGGVEDMEFAGGIKEIACGISGG